MESILIGGPWYVQCHVVGMDKWSPSFSPSSLNEISAPLWIRLPNLPLQCWDEINICRIASQVVLKSVHEEPNYGENDRAELEDVLDGAEYIEIEVVKAQVSASKSYVLMLNKFGILSNLEDNKPQELKPKSEVPNKNPSLEGKVLENSSSGKKGKLLKELKSLGSDSWVLGDKWDSFMVPSDGLPGGRELSNFEKVNKILRCLPSYFDAKITAITESKDLNTYSIDNLLGSLIAYEQGVNQRNLDAGSHVKADYPTLQDHSSKGKGEEKSKFRKDKKRLQKAFWADSASDSPETEPEDETTKLCLMADDHLDQEEGKRINNVYMLDLNNIEYAALFYLKIVIDDSWLWHRRLCHASMKTLRNVTQKDLVRGVSKLMFSKDYLCDACQLGKQVHSTFHPIKEISTSRPLEVLHMDLFGPISTASLGGKVYDFVIVDDYSSCEILTIHSDHGGEFENKRFRDFYEDKGISHNFSAPRTPQQNGVAERKNRTLVEATRAMLAEYSLPKYFWAEAVNTACYVLNRVNVRAKLEKTPYEILKGRTPNLSHLHVFSCKVFIQNNVKSHLEKLDPKSDEGVFLGYSSVGKYFRVFNKRTLVVEETTHVVFDESDPKKHGVEDDDDIGEITSGVENLEKEVGHQNIE
ncbi:hypothetical protein KFK09_022744 [Dendrobium nobile]|uniref:Integrase catalytic domain-containing protein n=1 Tax=Dendrobium nobile TaxID=94219 RepID=A0A8T3AK59_DENNO|nr:hypothetical protein KFK09_022744 [Dendrobium nobile]